MSTGSKSFHVKRVLTETGWLDNGIISMNDKGRIVSIEPATTQSQNNLMALPALIDTHIHGARGADVMDATHDALDTISVFLAQHGIGAFLATTVTSTHKRIEKAIEQVHLSMRTGVRGAMILGSYLEGPFFTEKNRGAHPENLLQAPSKELLSQWLAIGHGTVKCVALAPEYDGALEIISWLRTRGIRVMLGHSDASYEITKQALSAGANGIVHCYNGMSGLHHRNPGMVGAALTTPDCSTEIIADGHHVHCAAVKIALQCCQHNLLLISDAMRAAGMIDGDYYLGELLVHMQKGVVRLDNGALAGSSLSLDNAVSNFMQMTALSLDEAWRHASEYPAKSLGIDKDLGSLAPGKIANIVFMTPEHEIVSTWVNGRKAYEAFSITKNMVF